jgi:hypothetical protein
MALPYVSYVLDDALSADHAVADMLPNATLVGWQCGFEPLFVAVQSYLPDTRIDGDDAVEIAMDYLEEIGWFGEDGPRDCDYVILGVR